MASHEVGLRANRGRSCGCHWLVNFRMQACLLKVELPRIPDSKDGCTNVRGT